MPGVDVTDKDMESDEATWALYEQWCKAFNKVRDRSEMERRFHICKRTAGSVLSCNEAREGMPGSYARLGLYADGLDAQDIVESATAAVEAAGYGRPSQPHRQHVPPRYYKLIRKVCLV